MSETDGNGHEKVVVPMWNDEGNGSVRVTRIESSESLTAENALRIQIEDENGHVKQGPEFPTRILGDIVKVMIDLSLEK